MKKSLLIIPYIVLGILLTVGFSGCGDAGGAANTKAPVQLIIEGMSDYYVQSDVWTADGFFPDLLTVSVRVITVDPDFEDDPSRYMDVIVEGYEISYARKDTGYEVPKTFTGNLNIYCNLDAPIPIDMLICRADQKEQPPLSYLWQIGYEPSTGLEIIHTKCQIVVWGKTLAGKEVVSAPAYLMVDFANWTDVS